MPCRPSTLLLSLAALCVLSCTRSESTRPSERSAAGLTRSVEVVTDRWGIPYLTASSLDDLYYAWGWVHARDRLWQMVHARAAGDGKTHRWLGNAALRADGGAQLFRLRERARAIWERERGNLTVRSALESYAEGVNAYFALCRSGERSWPPELQRLREQPRDWEPEDCIVVLLGFGITLDLDLPELAEERALASGDSPAKLSQRRRFEDQWIYDSIPDSAAGRLWPRDLAAPARASVRLARHDAPAWSKEGVRQLDHVLATFPPQDADGASRASNAFVVGAKRSASGKPILANDPHLGLATPGPIHVLGVNVPGVLNAVGGGTPGLPVIVLGRNARVAWGVTALSPDVCDVYADTLSADGRQVRTFRPDGSSEWVPVEKRDYDMSFRFLGFTLPIPGFVQARRYTPHGPVLVWEPKQRRALSLRWAAFADSAITLTRLIGLEASANAFEVTSRFATLVTPCFNVVAADADGGAQFRCVGLLPARGFDPGPGVLPADGRHEWAGFIPTDSMPRWRVPETGFVSNGNNRPAGTAYPYSLPRYDWPHDRARRMAQRLAGDPSVTIQDAASIQNDVFSLAAQRNVPALLAAADPLREQLSPRQRQALDTLRAWNFMARRSKVAPTLYRAWFGAYQRHSRTEGLPGWTLASLTGQAPEPLAGTGKGGGVESPGEAAVAALTLALDTLGSQLGPDLTKWTYDRAHQARFRHVLSAKEVTRLWESPLTPVDGDNATPSVGVSRLPWSIEVTHGPAFRHVVDLARPELSWGVVAPWNAIVFEDKGERSLLSYWAQHDYVPLYLDAANVREPLDRTLLEPKQASVTPR